MLGYSMFHETWFQAFETDLPHRLAPAGVAMAEPVSVNITRLGNLISIARNGDRRKPYFLQKKRIMCPKRSARPVKIFSLIGS